MSDLINNLKEASYIETKKDIYITNISELNRLYNDLGWCWANIDYITNNNSFFKIIDDNIFIIKLTRWISDGVDGCDAVTFHNKEDNTVEFSIIYEDLENFLKDCIIIK